MSIPEFPNVPGCTLRVLFMFDNHTFANVTGYPVTNTIALETARRLFKKDGAGSLFIRWFDKPPGASGGCSHSVHARMKPEVIPEGDEWFGDTYGVLRSQVEAFFETARTMYQEYLQALPEPTISLLDVKGPSGTPLRSFHRDQWWMRELDSIQESLPSDAQEQKRAITVVRNLMATIDAAIEYEKTHPTK